MLKKEKRKKISDLKMLKATSVYYKVVKAVRRIFAEVPTRWMLLKRAHNIRHWRWLMKFQANQVVDCTVSTHDTCPKCFPIIISNGAVLSKGVVVLRSTFFRDRRTFALLGKISMIERIWALFLFYNWIMNDEQDLKQKFVT